MKKIFLLVTLISSCASFSQILTKQNHISREIEIIDIYDSVFFDLTKATLNNGNIIDIPVLIKSDDVINALDFALKYNHLNLLYDSIYDFTGHIQMSEYYNPNDSTIRFTSNSFNNYANNVQLVTIRFQMLSLTMTKSDLFAFNVYLNGDPCSYAIIGNVIGIGVEEQEKNNFANIYPNPTNELITIDATEHCSIVLLDINGKEIIKQTTVAPYQKKSLNIKDIPAGIYFIKMCTDQQLLTKKLIINH